MAKLVQTVGNVMIRTGDGTTGSVVSEYSLEATSGTLGSVIHGLRVELQFRGEAEITLSLGAADALQLSEELRAAVHRREDVRR